MLQIKLLGYIIYDFITKIEWLLLCINLFCSYTSREIEQFELFYSCWSLFWPEVTNGPLERAIHCFCLTEVHRLNWHCNLNRYPNKAEENLLYQEQTRKPGHLRDIIPSKWPESLQLTVDITRQTRARTTQSSNFWQSASCLLYGLFGRQVLGRLQRNSRSWQEILFKFVTQMT